MTAGTGGVRIAGTGRFRKGGGPALPLPPYARHLVIMVREPVAGRVKTRLAADLGVARSVSFYRHAIACVVAGVGGQRRRWCTWLAISPDGVVATRLLPAGALRVGQGAGDLGTRMQRLVDRLPPGPVVIIGSDVPGVRASLIAVAFRALGDHDAVLGPSGDGGYWLVGLRRFPGKPRAFHGVRWSSRHALDDTLSRLSGSRPSGCRVALVAPLDDVDTAADFARLSQLIGRRVLLHVGTNCRSVASPSAREVCP